MLDLETMGAGPDAAIIAIGAVTFDPHGGTIGERFYAPIDLASSVAAGGVQDPGTVQWWLRQSDAARAEIGRPGLQISSALDAFDVWLRRHCDIEAVKVWGNGAGFDNVILRRAHERIGRPAPWSHCNDRCYRTIKSMDPTIKIERTGTHHNALDDAESQAMHLLKLLRAWS
jgi:exodeoxyribonuclease VIII